jgi:hypothetical protein
VSEPSAPRYPTTEEAKTLCKMGQGHDCCRYLTMGGGGWSCEKHSSLRGMLDRRVETETIVARGDNCDGMDSR